MKIFEAYYNIKLRTGLKRYLLAEGRTLGDIDRLYSQFGIYLSRIKGIAYYNELINCQTEEEFRERLSNLFDNLWAGHMMYHEMPGYFIRYLDYLHTACALDPSLEIEGLEMPDDIWCVPGNEVTDYAKPYVNEGKLNIIANPLLIRQLLPFKESWPLSAEEAIATAKGFYGTLLPMMTDEDWRELIFDLLQPSKNRKAKATARYVELLYKDGTKKILSGNQAFEFILKEVGPDKLKSINVLHKGERIVSRTVEQRYIPQSKQLENGMWLNLRGNVSEKVKTLRLLISYLRLPYTVNLTNETP